MRPGSAGADGEYPIQQQPRGRTTASGRRSSAPGIRGRSDTHERCCSDCAAGTNVRPYGERQSDSVSGRGVRILSDHQDAHFRRVPAESPQDEFAWWQVTTSGGHLGPQKVPKPAMTSAIGASAGSQPGWTSSSRGRALTRAA